MSPANDNFASATLLSGASGHISGSNVDATSETGEPANNGKTVWFKFNPAIPGTYFFSTRWMTTAIPPTDFLSTVQVFLGSDVTALSEQTYVFNFSNGYLGENGAIVAVNLDAGYDYYIRVDGRGGASGSFALNWGNYYPFQISSCGTCDPDFGAGETCVATFLVSDLFTDQTTLLGDFAAGLYRFRYCNGFFQNYMLTLVFSCDGPGSNCQYSGHRYYTTGTGISIAWNSGSQAVPDQGSLVSSLNAGNAARCAQVLLPHAGGSIIASFSQYGGQFKNLPCGVGQNCGPDVISPTDGSTPQNGFPNPTWGLYSVAPALIISGIASNMRIGCTANYSGTFQIRNKGYAGWGGVSVRVLNAGEVTGASTTPVSMGDIPNNNGAVTTPTLAFSRTANIETAFDVELEITITKYNGVTLASLGIPDFTINLTCTLQPEYPATFTANGVSTCTRTGDNLSCGFRLNYSFPTGVGFFAGCGWKVRLMNTGGITDASADVAGFDGSGALVASFTFSSAIPNNTSLIATLEILDDASNIIGTLTYDLSPVISMSATILTGGFTCGGISSHSYNFQVRNTGLGPALNMVATLLSGTQCVNSSFPKSIGYLGPGAVVSWGNTSPGTTYFLSHPFTVQLEDTLAGLIYPNFTQAT
jgi:hypothetical protein